MRKTSIKYASLISTVNLIVENTVIAIVSTDKTTVLYPVLLKSRFQKNLEQPLPTAPTTPMVVRNWSSWMVCLT